MFWDVISAKERRSQKVYLLRACLSAPTQAMPNTDVASQNNMGTQMNQENWSHQANQSGDNQGMYGIPAKSETVIISEGCKPGEHLFEERGEC